MAEPGSTRDDYRWQLDLRTRWVDNDSYGHLNNAVYYSLFETTIMTWLETADDGTDAGAGEWRCFTVENGCRYHQAVAHPVRLSCRLRVAHVGNSSVRYECGVFAGEAVNPSATGFVVDVFVDRHSERPIRVPERIRAALSTLTS